jgi:transposase-like protein
MAGKDRPIKCKKCRAETTHEDMGIDLRKYRYKCRKCGQYNEPEETK